MRTKWLPCPAPVTPDTAYTARVHYRIVHLLAEIHDIQLGVASVLLRPMLHDLITTGTWEYRIATGHFRLSDAGYCHSFYWADALDHPSIKFYDASHPDTDSSCPQPLRPEAPSDSAPTWLPHFQDAAPPPPQAGNPWRFTLRRASNLPLTLFKPALSYFARHRLGTELTPDRVLTVFSTMADEAERVHAKWNGLPGTHYLTDSSGLIWKLASATTGSSKPGITGVLPPNGRPADRPAHQRARRMPGSSTLATGRRPT